MPTQKEAEQLATPPEPKPKPCEKCGTEVLKRFKVREKWMCEDCGLLEILSWNEMAQEPLGLPTGAKIG